MAQNQTHFDEEDIDLRRYITIVIEKWWVVLSIFLIAVALAFTYNSRLPNIYEARTKVLILSPVSERLLADEGVPGDRLPINPFLGSRISVDTLSSLGTSNDLLQDIIQRLGLRTSFSGELWSVEQLRSVININFENPGGSQATLPLITMTARSGDPDVVKRIAETWAELFIDQNSKIFATEATRSYNFVVSQFNETEKMLQVKEDEILQLERQSSLQSLESQLSVLTVKYEEFFDRLLESRSQIVGARAVLASTEEALSNEPQVVTLEQSIPTEALLVLLAREGDGFNLNGITELVSTIQETNELYLLVKGDVFGARSNISALASDIEYLDTQTLDIQKQIEELSIKIAKRRLILERLEREFTLLIENFDRLGRSLQQSQITKEEQSGFVQIVESAVKPRVPLARNGQRTILMAGVGGLLFGVVMAFIVNFAQETLRSRRKEDVD